MCSTKSILEDSLDLLLHTEVGSSSSCGAGKRAEAVLAVKTPKTLKVTPTALSLGSSEALISTPSDSGMKFL